MVGEAGDGRRRRGARSQRTPDVVLMDIRMPGIDGLTAQRQIGDDRAGRRSQVLVLTTFELDEYVFEALRAGASGFLLKAHRADRADRRRARGRRRRRR